MIAGKGEFAAGEGEVGTGSFFDELSRKFVEIAVKSEGEGSVSSLVASVEIVTLLAKKADALQVVVFQCEMQGGAAEFVWDRKIDSCPSENGEFGEVSAGGGLEDAGRGGGDALFFQFAESDLRISEKSFLVEVAEADSTSEK